MILAAQQALKGIGGKLLFSPDLVLVLFLQADAVNVY